MKASKQTLIVCWIITIVSLLGVVVLHNEIDIWIQEQITKTEWVYDYDIRDFYKNIYSNIFTGAIVSLLLTYVSYGQAKNNLEFQLKVNEQIMVLHFNSIASSMYSINLTHKLFEQNNCSAIARFKENIADIKVRYDRMIEASNDYCPFFMNKKSRNLTKGKKFLQEMWVEICNVEDSLLIYNKVEDIKSVIDSTRKKVEKRKTELDEVADSIKDY